MLATYTLAIRTGTNNQAAVVATYTLAIRTGTNNQAAVVVLVGEMKLCLKFGYKNVIK
jgi:hypothetical protein